VRNRPQPIAPFPVLLLEPNSQNAVQLARGLEAAGFQIRVEGSAQAALQAQRESFFFALIVVADLADTDCLAVLDALRRKAPRSWMLVAATDCDSHTCDLIRRHGGDACLALPVSLDDLTNRLDAFQLRARPSF
jgi:DNA-binding response OmpR family regulator